MTGRQRIEAALSSGGTADIPAVVCYEDLVIRDHWSQLTACPWWYVRSPRIEDQVAWRRDAIRAMGQDWFVLPRICGRDERRDLSIEEREGGVWLVNARTGKEERLEAPRVGGAHLRTDGAAYGRGPTCAAEADDALPINEDFDPRAVRSDGRGDLAARLLAEFGDDLLPRASVPSPLWTCLTMWGFEAGMVRVAGDRELVRYGVRRATRRAVNAAREAAALGAAVMCIEEAWTDLIGPADFAELNVPVLRELVDAIREAGMNSIYY